MAPRDSGTDAARLRFDLKTVLVIVGTALSVTTGQYLANADGRATQSQMAAAQSQMSSDIRDMKTRMEMQSQIDAARNEARTAEVTSQNEAINDLRRITQLLQLQYAELSKKVR